MQRTVTRQRTGPTGGLDLGLATWDSSEHPKSLNVTGVISANVRC